MVKKEKCFLKRRLVDNTKYSLNGIFATLNYEEAFRIEFIFALFLIPLGLYFGENLVEKIILVSSVVIILIVEILNSALENLVDRIGLGNNNLSGRVKDQGSAAVFLSISLFVFVWTILIIY